jgi:hypothetical protein
MLGGMAFQDPASVSVDALAVANTADINGVLVDTSGRVIIGQADTTGVDAEADDLIVSSTAHAGITVRSGSSHNASVYFADQDAVRQGRIEYNHTDNYMRFNTNGTEELRILSGGGITFNGDTAAANALDDYEEGTWTVNVYDAASGGNVSATTATGYYTKIGRCVSCLFASILNINTTGMTAGNLVYVSLPFVSSFATSALPGGTLFLEGITLPASNTYVTPVVSYNHGRFLIYTGGASGGPRTPLTVGNLTSGTTDFRYFQITYFI